MQKPQESLDDFLRPIEPQPAAPPSNVSLRPTGEVEILSPLPFDQPPARTANPLLLQRGAPRISWYHRSLIFGGGAVATIVLVFLSAVFIAVNEPSYEASIVGVDTPDYAAGASADDPSLAPAEETAVSEALTSAIAALVSGELRAVRAVVKSKRSLPRVIRAASIPRRDPRPARQVTEFVPTTLIIYPENGEIKTRIEPTLTAAYKIPVSFAN